MCIRDSNCAMAIILLVEGSEKYICVQCKPQTIGKIVNYSFFKNGGMYRNYEGIGDCNYNSYVLEEEYVFQDYNKINSPEYNNLLFSLRFLNCGESHYQAFYIQVVDFFKLEEKIQEEIVYKQPINTCFSITDPAINKNIDIPNCQVYSFQRNLEIKEKADVKDCLACVPGYSPVYSETGWSVIACNPIPNCSPNSMILNGCSHPIHGLKVNSMGYIMLDQPLQAMGTIPNCLVFSSDESQCLVCQRGFEFESGACNTVSNSDPNCEQKGYSLSLDLQLTQNENTNSLMIHYLSFLNNRLDLLNNHKEHCIICKSSFHYVTSQKQKARILQQNNDPCQKIEDLGDNFTVIENCKMYSGTSCFQCEDNFLYDEDSKKCISNSGKENCLSMNISGCTKCLTGKTLDFSNNCVDTNCALFYNEECSLCKNGYKFITQSKTYCMAMNPNDPEDNCEAYSPLMETCAICKNGTLIIFYDMENLKINDYICDSNIQDFTKSGWKNYNLTAPFIQVNLMGDKVMSTELNFINHDALGEDSMQFFSSPSTNPAISHCHPGLTFPNCSEAGLQNNIFCSECEEGSYMDSITKKCIMGEMEGCQIYISKNTCTTCDNEKYYLENGKCKIRILIDKCATYDIETNSCIACEEGYLKQLNGRCEMITTNESLCKTLDKQTCLECIDGYYFTENRCVLVPNQIPNCLSYLNETECKLCQPNYLLSEELNECIETKLEFCLEPIDNYNCKKCEDNYVLEDKSLRVKNPEGQGAINIIHSTCVSSGIENCEDALGGSEKTCLKCAEGYVPSEDLKSCIISKKIFFCDEYFSATQCLTCMPGYVRTSNRQLCLPVSNKNIENCTSLAVGKTVYCSECQLGFRSDENGKCIACDKGCAICKQQEDNNGNISFKCALCSFEYYMNESEKCVSIRELKEKNVNRLFLSFVSVLLSLFLIQ